MWTLGIDASRANQTRRTGLPLYNLRVLQELRQLVPPEVRVVLYASMPPCAELSVLPSGWTFRRLRWRSWPLWSQIRLSLEMLRRPPDILLSLHHLLPAVCPRKTVALIADVGFGRMRGLYGKDSEADRLWQRLAGGVLRVATRNRYGLGEEDYHHRATRHAARRATRLLVVSRFTHSEVVSLYGVPAERLDVAYPGVDVERLDAPVAPARRAAAMRQHGVRPPYVLYLGRLERKKNVATLVTAFARQKRAAGLPHQLVLGGSPGKGYAQIRAAIADSGLAEGDIVQPGWVADEDLVPLLQGASAFAFVSAYEGFGIPVLEAQAAGTPVVCADLPALHEAAGDAAVYCDQSRPEAVARALGLVLTDAPLRRQLVHRGRQHCRTFTWQECARSVWNSVRRAYAAP
jgi:glycosyltransferase involved in cell wall biosynthesis